MARARRRARLRLSGGDYEASIAAHFLARHQPSLNESLYYLMPLQVNFWR
jgi:hypothetical protein